MESWAARTPRKFRFLVKLHKQTTHERDNEAREIDELLACLAPLRETSPPKLAGLLAQFPASFHASAENEGYLSILAERCEGIPVFFEFRHRSWDNERAVELCARLHAGWVAVDLPPIRSLPAPRPAVTVNRGYVRLHGRNAKTWYDQDAGDRYDWDYSERQLRQWLPRLAALESRSEETFLFFNNCYMGQAVKNALLMKEILQRQFEVV